MDTLKVRVLRELDQPECWYVLQILGERRPIGVMVLRARGMATAIQRACELGVISSDLSTCRGQRIKETQAQPVPDEYSSSPPPSEIHEVVIEDMEHAAELLNTWSKSSQESQKRGSAPR